MLYMHYLHFKTKVHICAFKLNSFFENLSFWVGGGWVTLGFTTMDKE